MEKLERLLIQITNLMKKEESNRVAQAMLENSFSAQFEAREQGRNSAFESQSHQILAEMKLKEFEDLFEKVDVYDQVIEMERQQQMGKNKVVKIEQSSSDDEHLEGTSSEDEPTDQAIRLDKAYLLDLLSRYNQIKKKVVC